MLKPESGRHVPAGVHMAYVEIEGLVVDMEVGHLERDRGRIQRVTFSARVGFDDGRTHIEDSVAALADRGMDPGALRGVIVEACKAPAVLLETLANRIALGMFKLPGVETLDLKITKAYSWADTEKTSLTIHRARSVASS